MYSVELNSTFLHSELESCLEMNAPLLIGNRSVVN
jgi:hypothetical protein